MEPISALASIIAVYQLASAVGINCFRYAKGMQQSKSDSLLLLGQVNIFQTSLVNLRNMVAEEEELTGNKTRLKHLNSILDGHSASLKLCETELDSLQTKLDKAQSHVGFKEILHKMYWPLKRDEVLKAVEALREFVKAVDNTLALDTNKTVRQLDTKMDQARTSVDQTKFSVRSIEAHQKLDQEARKEKEAKEAREKVLEWLAHPDPSEYQFHTRHARNRDIAKTGRWFLDGAQFKTFKQRCNSFLWLHGDSGCGKSTLCSTVIDDLHTDREKDPSVQVAYWYFSENDTKRMSFDNLVRSLVAQLIPANAVPPSLLKLWEAKRNGQEPPKVWDLIQTLEEILVEGNSYFIIIDAVDESEESERANCVNLAQRLATLAMVGTHVLVTSRSHTLDDKAILRVEFSFFDVPVERQYADEDILAHIRERLQNDDVLREWPATERKEIEMSLMEKAAGNFQWVAAQLKDIRKCKKISELRMTLNSLPRDIHMTYARDLANVEERRSKDAIKLIDWLAFPQRPLRIEEAMDLLAVDLAPNPPTFDKENRMILAEGLHEGLGSIVRTDWNPKGIDSLGRIAGVKTLNAAHGSVIEYLKTQPIRVGSTPPFRLTRPEANLRMAETCLTYLHYIINNKIILSENNIEDFPLARLSAELWDDFYREVVQSSSISAVDMTRLNELTMGIFSSPAVMLKWIQICDPDNDWKRVDFGIVQSEVKSAIYYASLLGLPDIVTQLINDGQGPNEVCSTGYGTPLVAACAHGRTEIVSLLLISGADASLYGSRVWGCPLAVAIKHGHIDIVKILLSQENVGIHDLRVPCRPSEPKSDHDLMLNAGRSENSAVTETQIETVSGQHTYSRWVNVHDSKESANHLKAVYNQEVAVGSNESVLYIAARDTSSEIVELLLEAGASPHFPGGEHYTVLETACQSGDKESVRLLLKHGADMDVYGSFCGSALQYACHRGDIGIVRLLVDAGVNPNPPCGGYKESPMYIAAVRQNAEMIDLLLSCGAMVNVYAGHYDNPLQVASMDGDIETVRKLLRAGSDVNRKGGRWETALCAACAHDHYDIARLLLENGANPNASAYPDRDIALHLACCENGGNLELVRLLLDQGADPNFYGGDHESALHAAFSIGAEPIIRLLLEKGASIDHIGADYGSVLDAALHDKSGAAVSLALDLGVPANDTSIEGLAPLWRAGANHTILDSAVLTLLKHGADPNAHGQFGQAETILHVACSESKVGMLLDYGAEVNKCNSLNAPALHYKIFKRYSVDMVTSLLEHGADYGLIATTLERVTDDHTVVAARGTALDIACEAGNFDAVEPLVKAGAHIHALAFGGRSPLHRAAGTLELNQIGLLDILANIDAEPLRLDRRGCNCLHYAARLNNWAFLEHMLKAGADVNTTDDAGWTPLHWASAGNNRSEETVELLMRYGCDMTRKESILGLTPSGMTEKFFDPSLIIPNDKAWLSDWGNFELISKAAELKLSKCHGCGMTRDHVKNQSWHRCNEASCQGDFPIDFCFRCLYDKDVLHDPGHAFDEVDLESDYARTEEVQLRTREFRLAV